MYPKAFTNCSSEQVAYLGKAWPEAYRYVYAANRLLTYIHDQPAGNRSALWSQDMGTGLVPSPRRYFGPYDAHRFSLTREAVSEVLDGFRRKRVTRFSCLKNCAADIDGDVPSAFHTRPIITLCKPFWDRALNGFATPQARLSSGR